MPLPLGRASPLPLPPLAVPLPRLPLLDTGPLVDAPAGLEEAETPAPARFGVARIEVLSTKEVSVVMNVVSESSPVL